MVSYDGHILFLLIAIIDKASCQFEGYSHLSSQSPNRDDASLSHPDAVSPDHWPGAGGGFGGGGGFPGGLYPGGLPSGGLPSGGFPQSGPGSGPSGGFSPGPSGGMIPPRGGPGSGPSGGYGPGPSGGMIPPRGEPGPSIGDVQPEGASVAYSAPGSMNIPSENPRSSVLGPSESKSPDTLTDAAGSGLGTGVDSEYTDSPPSFSSDDGADDDANIAQDSMETTDNTDDPNNLAGNADAHQKGTPNNTTVEMVIEDNFNYVGLYVTIAIFITFIVTLIAIALIRGPQGPFKTKRTHDDAERSDGVRAEMVAVGASDDGADIATRTDSQWEQQPLKSDCDHNEAPDAAATTVVNEDGGNSKEDGV